MSEYDFKPKTYSIHFWPKDKSHKELNYLFVIFLGAKSKNGHQPGHKETERIHQRVVERICQRLITIIDCKCDIQKDKLGLSGKTLTEF